MSAAPHVQATPPLDTVACATPFTYCAPYGGATGTVSGLYTLTATNGSVSGIADSYETLDANVTNGVTISALFHSTNNGALPPGGALGIVIRAYNDKDGSGLAFMALNVNSVGGCTGDTFCMGLRQSAGSPSILTGIGDYRSRLEGSSGYHSFQVVWTNNGGNATFTINDCQDQDCYAIRTSNLASSTINGFGSAAQVQLIVANTGSSDDIAVNAVHFTPGGAPPDQPTWTASPTPSNTATAMPTATPPVAYANDFTYTPIFSGTMPDTDGALNGTYPITSYVNTIYGGGYSVDTPQQTGNGGSNTALQQGQWRGDEAVTTTASTPAWFAVDLSRVPDAKRQTVQFSWSDTMYGAIATYAGCTSGEQPQNYDYEINTAVGSTYPTTGWQIVKTVTGNCFHHVDDTVAITGANWLRLNVTQLGSVQQYFASIDLQINLYNASDAYLNQSGIFDIGDSITQGRANWTYNGSTDGLNATYGDQHIVLRSASNNALMPNLDFDGVAGTTAARLTNGDLARDIGRFKGRFVVMAFGMNDANGSADVNSYINAYNSGINQVEVAGMIPVIPLITWTYDPGYQPYVKTLNQALVTNFASRNDVIMGPDFWDFFRNHQNLVGCNGGWPNPLDVHPDCGYGYMNELWGNWMAQTLYKQPSLLYMATPPINHTYDVLSYTPTPTVTATPMPTVTSTIIPATTATPTFTPSVTHATNTAAVPTETVTSTSPVTAIPSLTNTAVMDSPSPTLTGTAMAVTSPASATVTLTVTATVTEPVTITLTPTGTPSTSPSATSTWTATSTATTTPLNTATIVATTPLSTSTVTSTGTPMSSATSTGTTMPMTAVVPTDTATATSTLTMTTPVSTVVTSTDTSAASSSALLTSTPTNAPTPSDTSLPTATGSTGNTPLPTAIPTSAATPTAVRPTVLVTDWGSGQFRTDYCVNSRLNVTLTGFPSSTWLAIRVTPNALTTVKTDSNGGASTILDLTAAVAGAVTLLVVPDDWSWLGTSPTPALAMVPLTISSTCAWATATGGDLEGYDSPSGSVTFANMGSGLLTVSVCGQTLLTLDQGNGSGTISYPILEAVSACHGVQGIYPLSVTNTTTGAVAYAPTLYYYNFA